MKKIFDLQIKGLNDFQNLEDISLKIGDNFEKLRKRQKELNEELKKVSKSSTEYKKIEKELKTIDSLLDDLSTATEKAFDTQAIEKASDEVDEFGDSIKDASNDVNGFSSKLSKTEKLLTGFNSTTDLASKGIDLLTKALEGTQSGTETLLKTDLAIKGVSADISRLVSSVLSSDNIFDAFEKLKEGADDLFKRVKSGTGTYDEYIKALRNANNEQINFNINSGKFEKIIAQTDKAVDDTNRSFAVRLQSLKNLENAQLSLLTLQKEEAEAQRDATRARLIAVAGIKEEGQSLDVLIKQLKEKDVTLEDIILLTKQQSVVNTIAAEKEAILADNIERRNSILAEQRDLFLELEQSTISEEIERLNEQFERNSSLEFNKSLAESKLNVKDYFDTLRTFIIDNKNQSLKILEETYNFKKNGISKTLDNTLNDIETRFNNTGKTLTKEQKNLLKDLTNLTAEGFRNAVKQGTAGTELLSPEEIRIFSENLAEKEKLEVGYLNKREDVNEKTSEKLNETKKNEKETIKQNLIAIINTSTQLLSAIADFGTQLLDNQIENIKNRINNVDEQIDEVKSRISESESEALDSLNNIKSLEDQLASARVANTNEIREALANERSERKKNLDELKSAQKEEENLLKQKDKLEDELAKKERQRAKIEKAQAIAQAAINGALAITQINANPFVNSEISQTLRITLTALISSITAAQIATIAAQPLKQGGLLKSESEGGVLKYQDGGMINGPSHSQGGVPFSVGGRVGFEAEGGEYIVNKRSTSKFLPLLESINKSKFQNGGIVQPNTSGVETTIKTDNSDVIMALDKFSKRPSYVSVQEIDDTRTNIEVVEDRADF